MSLLFDIVKTAQGESIEKVSPHVRDARLSVCGSCPFMQGGVVRSCGKYLKGGTVQYKGKEMELCGCNIDDKTKYAYDGCPLEKW